MNTKIRMGLLTYTASNACCYNLQFCI